MPIVRPGKDGVPEVTPLGFVLTKERLITVRFVDLPAFDALAAKCHEANDPEVPSTDVLANLLGGIVDRIADVLERVGGDLDRVSHTIFHAGAAKGARPRQADDELRRTLRDVGQGGDLLSKLRDTLLGMGRIVPYCARQRGGMGRASRGGDVEYSEAGCPVAQ